MCKLRYCYTNSEYILIRNRGHISEHTFVCVRRLSLLFIYFEVWDAYMRFVRLESKSHNRRIAANISKTVYWNAQTAASPNTPSYPPCGIDMKYFDGLYFHRCKDLSWTLFIIIVITIKWNTNISKYITYKFNMYLPTC